MGVLKREVREPGYDGSGRRYAEPLDRRLDRVGEMVGQMCAERRPPRMSIPAGSGLHNESRCSDEDIFILDAVEDARAVIATLRARVEELETGIQRLAASADMICDDEACSPSLVRETLRSVRDVARALYREAES